MLKALSRAKSTTALLVEKLDTTNDVHKLCNSIFSPADKQGINSVHDITIDNKKITHAFFSNLETGAKSFVPTGRWPSKDVVDVPLARVIRRYHSTTPPNFFPSKGLQLTIAIQEKM